MRRVQVVFLLLSLAQTYLCGIIESHEENGVGYAGGSSLGSETHYEAEAAGYGGQAAVSSSGGSVTTHTQEVPVAVPHPVPIPVNKPVPYPVPHPYPVSVPRPVEILVPVPQPVPVPKPVPVTVSREVPYPVPQPIQVPIPYAVPVAVPQPYTVTIPQPTPVKIPQTVVVPVPVVVEGEGGSEGAYGYSTHGHGSETSIYSDGKGKTLAYTETKHGIGAKSSSALELGGKY